MGRDEQVHLPVSYDILSVASNLFCLSFSHEMFIPYGFSVFNLWIRTLCIHFVSVGVLKYVSIRNKSMLSKGGSFFYTVSSVSVSVSVEARTHFLCFS